MTPFERLHPALQHHIVNSLGWATLRPIQEQAIEPLLAGEHALIIGPTAGGKTEAAFLPLLSRSLTEGWQGLSLLYVCPIRALLNNLETRLTGYAGFVGRRVELWHGDVREAARRHIRRTPPDILLTTPESIEVMLVSQQSDPRVLFGSVRAVVVDELHAFAGDDRGWHLLSVLARVQHIAGGELQRVGLSATIGNASELIEWLVSGGTRPRRVIAPGGPPPASPDVELDYVGTVANAAKVVAHLHRGDKRLVFVDSRARVEQLAAELRTMGVATFVSHSSLSTDERHRAEAAFSEGNDCVIVATSTLELGIDVGDLDWVIQIDAPATVSAFLQRLGRTGRRPGTRRNCLFLALSDDAFLRATGLIQLSSEGYVEPVVPPAEPFHILAQQVLALTLQEGGIGRSRWREWVGTVPAFAAMTAEDIRSVLDYMVERTILFDEAGILSVGPEGERSFGYRNFMELFSVFTSPPSSWSSTAAPNSATSTKPRFRSAARNRPCCSSAAAVGLSPIWTGLVAWRMWSPLSLAGSPGGWGSAVRCTSPSVAPFGVSWQRDVARLASRRAPRTISRRSASDSPGSMMRPLRSCTVARVTSAGGRSPAFAPTRLSPQPWVPWRLHESVRIISRSPCVAMQVPRI